MFNFDELRLLTDDGADECDLGVGVADEIMGLHLTLYIQNEDEEWLINYKVIT